MHYIIFNDKQKDKSDNARVALFVCYNIFNMCQEENCSHGFAEPEFETAGVQDAETRLSTALAGARMALIEHAPVLARQTEVSSECACSGVCPNCLSVGAGSLALQAISKRASSLVSRIRSKE